MDFLLHVTYLLNLGILIYVLNRLFFFQCLTYFPLFNHSRSLHTVFSSNIDKVCLNQSLLMYLTLETFMPIIRTGFIFLVELIDLMNTLIFWSHANLDFRFLIQIQDCDLQSPALQNFFISSDHSTYSTFAFPP